VHINKSGHCPENRWEGSLKFSMAGWLRVLGKVMAKPSTSRNVTSSLILSKFYFYSSGIFEEFPYYKPKENL